MKRNLLSIGKMAEMNQTTVPTLRLYDQLGLPSRAMWTGKPATGIMTSTRTRAWT